MSRREQGGLFRGTRSWPCKAAVYGLPARLP